MSPLKEPKDRLNDSWVIMSATAASTISMFTREWKRKKLDGQPYSSNGYYITKNNLTLRIVFVERATV